ncbi:MAG: FAD-dependent oxidoreductase [Anaerolineaceae bacterium]|jgi:nitrite reductase (NADH) large subunit|nr:FAD-dependent oxidoreductase [Anaerolineaceae bacterium]MDD4043403.1 FAD-dependent oxidoreductase [Anaerolineaceae bacterium]MDD4578013.1 FAD-dependent oxidoreductase [Anaerolineaceae bacterium]
MTKSPNKTHFLIAGGGIAGVSAVEAIHKVDSEADITLISEEPVLPYFRMSLTRYLAGELDRSQLDLHKESWYLENHINLVLSRRITKIDAESKQVTLDDGQLIEYDKLILANGASPFVPPIPGKELSGVMTLRSLEDADRILQTLDHTADIVCIGGGLLGLEIAGAIARHGSKVTVLEALEWLLPRQLGQEAAEMLRKQISTMGISVTVPAKITGLVGEEKVEGVEIAGPDGEAAVCVPAELVLISAGVRPNLDLAKMAGVEVNKGVLVNEHMQTSKPDIYAAGDVTEFHGISYGLWIPARKQGEVAGRHAAGAPAEFAGDPPAAKLKVLGIDLFSIGQFLPTEAGDRLVTSKKDDSYVSMLFRNGILIGANLLGETGLDAKVRKAIEAKTDFSNVLRDGVTVDEVVAQMG